MPTQSGHHPSPDGCAERAVRVFEEGMKKMGEGGVETKLPRFLFKCRSTPPDHNWSHTGGASHEQEDRDTVGLGVSVTSRPGWTEPSETNRAARQARPPGTGFSKSLTRSTSEGQKWIPVTGPVSWKVETQDHVTTRTCLNPVHKRRTSSLQEPVNPALEVPATETAHRTGS